MSAKTGANVKAAFEEFVSDVANLEPFSIVKSPRHSPQGSSSRQSAIDSPEASRDSLRESKESKDRDPKKLSRPSFSSKTDDDIGAVKRGASKSSFFSKSENNSKESLMSSSKPKDLLSNSKPKEKPKGREKVDMRARDREDREGPKSAVDDDDDFFNPSNWS